MKRCNYHFCWWSNSDLDRIYDIAKKYGIILIEDCRSSLGATIKMQKG
ncbi:MAG: DegT/DnrJ/EryC1/StrS family aminotransferase [Aliarcobacter sp.]